MKKHGRSHPISPLRTVFCSLLPNYLCCMEVPPGRLLVSAADWLMHPGICSQSSLTFPPRTLKLLPCKHFWQRLIWMYQPRYFLHSLICSPHCKGETETGKSQNLRCPTVSAYRDVSLQREQQWGQRIFWMGKVSEDFLHGRPKGRMEGSRG